MNYTIQEFFDKANELMIINPPNKEDYLVLLDKVSEYGIGPESKFDFSSFNKT